MKRSEKKAQTQTRILTIARQLYIKQGPKQTDMRELAQHANVSTATLYRYFPTKELLTQTVVTDYFTKINEQIDQLLQRPDLDFYGAMNLVETSIRKVVGTVNEDFLACTWAAYQANSTLIALFNFDSAVWQKLIRLGRKTGEISASFDDEVVFMYIDMFFQYFRKGNNVQKFGLNKSRLQQLDNQLRNLFFQGLRGQ